jgi:hypothetical protein
MKEIIDEIEKKLQTRGTKKGIIRSIMGTFKDIVAQRAGRCQSFNSICEEGHI